MTAIKINGNILYLNDIIDGAPAVSDRSTGEIFRIYTYNGFNVER